MQFRTAIDVPRAPFSIEHGDVILPLGSCFSAHMSLRLREALFHLSDNPFGTTYNPISLAQQVNRIREGRLYEIQDLEKNDDLFLSFDHYTAFSHTDESVVLDQINQLLKQAHDALSKTRMLLITLGTAHAWKHKASDQIVNNCHKLPGQRFERVLLSAESISDHLYKALAHLQKAWPEISVLITVSPVRHLRDGAIANQRSKATLIVAAHETAEKIENVHYFPAYELMMDDLRDYRYYADDMLHPSVMAVEYIWRKFSESVLSDKSREALPRIEKLTRYRDHRSDKAHSSDYRKGLSKMLDLLEKEKSLLPEANWEELENALRSR